MSYVYDNKKKFALINPLSVPEEYLEAVYITEEIPIDCNWGNLVYDIERQNKGEKAMKIPTRFSLILKKAYDISLQILDKKYENIDFQSLIKNGCPWSEEEEIECVKHTLLSMGYGKKDITDMDTNDINQDFLANLIN